VLEKGLMNAEQIIFYLFCKCT